MSDSHHHHRDRISQAYLGSWGSLEMQARVRRRVKWMASQPRGATVVDLGCSEGILPILLARRGFQVTGIDINPDAIAFANDLRDQEAPQVRARLTFVEADAFGYEAPASGFDNVVLGEVIEHLSEPDKMIARAGELLRDGGRLVLTTPFGFLPHDDHHQTFMPSHVRALLAEGFRLESVDMTDGYIRAVALRDRQASGGADSFVAADLALTEQAVLDEQRRLYASLDKIRRRGKEGSRRYQDLAADFDAVLGSVRYRLGLLLVNLAKSPGQILTVPGELLSIYRQHKKKASSTAFGEPPPHGGASTSTEAVPELSMPAAEIPNLEPRSRTKIAAILDAFSARCFQFEGELIFLKKETWQAQLEAERPDFFFAESAWHGNEGDWSRLFQTYKEDKSNPLRALLRYCRSANVPSVFWNKEDPPNFDFFIDAAKDFDHIFTTDADCVPRYKAVCGHDRVYPLSFAAQPAIHNPIGKSESNGLEVAFAGTWYARKHQERSALLPILLDACLTRDLVIFDRMSEYRIDRAYSFPAKYQGFVRRALSYDQMLTAHRRFKLFLNPNSVTDSPTMFSRRVFEILACSTPVVSTASRGIESTFEDIVPVVHSTEEAKTTIDRILGDDAYRRRLGHSGYRKVMREHTYEVRLREIMAAVGIAGPQSQEPAKVTIVLPLSGSADTRAAVGKATQQSYANLEVLVVASKDVVDARQEEAFADTAASVRWLEAPGDGTRAAALCAAMEASTGDYWTVFSEDDIYGEDYVWDLLLPFGFCDAGVVGKGAHFVQPGKAGQLGLRHPELIHRYVGRLQPAAIMIDRRVLSRVSIPWDDPDPIDAFLEACCRAEIPLYAADPYNYVQICPGDLGQCPEAGDAATKLSDVIL